MVSSYLGTKVLEDVKHPKGYITSFAPRLGRSFCGALLRSRSQMI